MRNGARERLAASGTARHPGARAVRGWHDLCMWRVRARRAVPLLRKRQQQKSPPEGGRYKVKRAGETPALRKCSAAAIEVEAWVDIAAFGDPLD